MPHGGPIAPKTQSGGSMIGFIALAIAVLGLLTAGGFYVYSRPTIDPVTGCRTNGPPAAVTLILVDVTDKLTLSQQLSLENRFSALAIGGDGGERIKPHEKVELYLTAGAPLAERPEPLATLCNPGGEADSSFVTDNVPLVKQRWKRAFADPFGAAVENALNRPKEPNSFIFASLQIAVQLLKHPEYGNAPRRLILVSDLLENSDVFNFYKKVPDVEEVMASRRFLSLRTDFKGITVDIWFLRRPADNVEWKAVLNLWVALLRLQGADGNIQASQIDG